jgi:outer membrane lipoprotein-sorting protein
LRKKLSITLLICTLALTSALSFASDPDQSVMRIQKAYEGITDMRGAFVQKNVIKDLNKTDTYTGEFFIKRPLRMKWAYRGKAAQDLIINNETVLIYKKGDSQAYRSKFSKRHMGRPCRSSDRNGQYQGRVRGDGKGDNLVLKPKKPMAGIASITLPSDGDFPIRLTI